MSLHLLQLLSELVAEDAKKMREIPGPLPQMYVGVVWR